MLKYTHIDHVYCHEHDLSILQYCILDQIYRLSTSPKSKLPGWCTLSRSKQAEDLRVTKPTIITNIDKLVILGMLEKNDKGNTRTTPLFYDNYEDRKSGIEYQKPSEKNRGLSEKIGKETLPSKNERSNNFTEIGKEILPHRSKNFTEIGKETLPYSNIHEDNKKKHGVYEEPTPILFSIWIDKLAKSQFKKFPGEDKENIRKKVFSEVLKKQGSVPSDIPIQVIDTDRYYDEMKNWANEEDKTRKNWIWVFVKFVRNDMGKGKAKLREDETPRDLGSYKTFSNDLNALEDL